MYNRIQYLELSTFFFAYSGLFMAMLEYEMRYYFLNGEYEEGQTPNHTQPLGISPERQRMLTLLLMIGLLCTVAMGVCVAVRYHLQLVWKIQKKLLISSDSLITTKEYQNLAVELVLFSFAPLPGLHNMNINEFYQDLQDPATN